ncbi:hypothetical protein AX14_007046, partial [Amanita brunnescens Koide BX004]
MGHRIKTRIFDNSAREALAKHETATNNAAKTAGQLEASRGLVPGSAAYARQHPTNVADGTEAVHTSTTSAPTTDLGLDLLKATPQEQVAANSLLQTALRILNARPPTPAAFVAT